MSTAKERAEFLKRFNDFSDAEEAEAKKQRKEARASLRRLRKELHAEECDAISERLLVAAMKRKGIQV